MTHYWNSTIKIKPKRKKRKLKKLGLKRLPALKTLKNKADAVFSKFIRARDKYVCVLCKSTKNIQCGHLIKRGKKSVRFDEVNCHALCSSCNWRDNYDHDIYVTWFIREYGSLVYEDLFDRSRGTKKLTRAYLEEIIRKYEGVSPQDT